MTTFEALAPEPDEGHASPCLHCAIHRTITAHAVAAMADGGGPADLNLVLNDVAQVTAELIAMVPHPVHRDVLLADILERIATLVPQMRSAIEDAPQPRRAH